MNDSLRNFLKFEQDTGREGQHLLTFQCSVSLENKRDECGRGRIRMSLN
jgi:hypothetical protein